MEAQFLKSIQEVASSITYDKFLKLLKDRSDDKYVYLYLFFSCNCIRALSMDLLIMLFVFPLMHVLISSFIGLLLLNWLLKS